MPVKKANSAFMKPLTLSADLEAVVGKGPMPRSEVVKKLWAYIKKNGLQDQKNKLLEDLSVVRGKMQGQKTAGGVRPE